VVLATGGGGHLYTNTTNPAQAAGEGIALAWTAGAAVEDLEFVQFHPTALKLPGAPCFLISEAVRGEGGRLVDQAGHSPVTDLPGADLAPRDQVSRALVKCMRDQGIDHVGLDLSGIPRDQAERRFPTILDRCRNLDLNPLEQPIPVAPAAHYWMGGVATDLTAATSLPGLYAVGEVACTGLHGANRLASNSLMECLVFARQLGAIDLPAVSEDDRRHWTLPEQRFQPSQTHARSRTSMGELARSIDRLSEQCWDVAGVNRSTKGMQTLLKLTTNAMAPLEQEELLRIVNHQQHEQQLALEEPSRQELNLLLDLLHRQRTSALLLEACLFRAESRGGHFRIDAPSTLPQWQRHSRQIRDQRIHTRQVND
tara:strand:- start:11 stop:1117 length:1107 start_codon:yes stop_codon:yes gene_type:complete